jgi:hypothetical protein
MRRQITFATLALIIATVPHTASATVASAVRMHKHTTYTRLVVEVSDTVGYTFRRSASPYRLTIDVPGLEWAVANQATSPTGVISGVHVGSRDSRKTEILVDLAGPVEVVRSFVLPENSTLPTRLVVDLKAATRKAFLADRAVGEPRPQLASKGVAEPAKDEHKAEDKPVTLAAAQTSYAKPQISLLSIAETDQHAPSAPLEDEPSRRRPGREELPPALPPIDPNAVPPPEPAIPRETLPVPDRWRLVEAIGVKGKWWDPYNQNSLKADRPMWGEWFVNVGVTSDTVYEPRGVPTPTGLQGDTGPNRLDPFVGAAQNVFVQNVIGSFSLIKGDTAFRPPNIEIRVTPVFSFNRVTVDAARALNVNPARGNTRNDTHVGLQEAFVDYHIRNVSDRFDFDSLRIGIQPVILDFRGFLFLDQQLGVRLFGNRNNNRWQYNAGWFRRLEKDTNSGLNDLGRKPRKDDVFFANVYRQDFPVHGYTVEGLVAYNRNREGNENPYYDKNGFLVRPASTGFERPFNYDVVYVGFNGDGHFGRFNLTHSFYAAFGNISANQFTSFVEDEPAKIRSYFFAIEPSVDFDWIRVRGQFLYASGDKDPFDNKAGGFDAIVENPQFAGAETSYWIRQAVPLVGGGGVALSGRNGLLNSLRSSKDQGQSNFFNPGTVLLGGGADFDVLPELRLSANINHLAFANRSVVEVLRNQKLSSNSIGWDVSAAAVYRPTFINNVVFRASGATLFGGKAFKELFLVDGKNGQQFYSVLLNLILTY